MGVSHGAGLVHTWSLSELFLASGLSLGPHLPTFYSLLPHPTPSCGGCEDEGGAAQSQGGDSPTSW